MAYSVKVTITSGPDGLTVYTPQVSQGDDTPGNVAAAYGLADPLVITQRLQDNPRLPLSHPEPDEATVNLIAPDSTTYSAMALGDPIAVQLYPQAAFAGTPVTFYGRIRGLAASPHPLGVLYTLSCVDYTADLAEFQAGVGAYPVEDATARLNRITSDAGLPALTKIGGWTSPTEKMAARSAGASDCLSLILDVLDSWRIGGFVDETNTAFSVSFHTIDYRPVLTPIITGGLLDTATPYGIALGQMGAPNTRRARYSPPGRLALVAGKTTVTLAAANSSPSSGSTILDGGLVEFAPVFSQDKGKTLPNVTVATDAQGNRATWDWRAYNTQWAAGGYVLGIGGWTPVNPAFNPQGPQFLQLVDSILDVSQGTLPGDAPTELLQLYRTPFAPDPRVSWSVGTLRYHAWKEATPWRRPQLTEMLTVARAQTGKLPNSREWVNGLVAATTVTVAKGRPVIDIDLLPNSYDHELNRSVLGATLGVVSMDSPILTGILLSGLNTRDTLDDYRIVRGS